MPLLNRNITRPVTQVATANGTSGGVIYVTDPSMYPVGAVVVVANNTTSVDCKVVDIVAPNGLLLRAMPKPDASGYMVAGGGPMAVDLSSYTTASSAQVTMRPQMLLTENADPIGLMPGKTVVVALVAGNATQAVVGGVQYRVVTDTACSIAIGSAAATANDAPLIANLPEIMVFGPVGSTPTLNAFAAATGHLYLTPMVTV
jgi:hypothetical protein